MCTDMRPLLHLHADVPVLVGEFVLQAAATEVLVHQLNVVEQKGNAHGNSSDGETEFVQDCPVLQGLLLQREEDDHLRDIFQQNLHHRDDTELHLELGTHWDLEKVCFLGEEPGSQQKSEVRFAHRQKEKENKHRLPGAAVTPPLVELWGPLLLPLQQVSGGENVDHARDTQRQAASNKQGRELGNVPDTQYRQEIGGEIQQREGAHYHG
mmetsp:Transcript_4263/g.8155  ORF Transcript_4263/g.8155 Transcript_4263/m.8155 type:complete len:210 (-) Transcript_4263:310-939(-)